MMHLSSSDIFFSSAVVLALFAVQVPMTLFRAFNDTAERHAEAGVCCRFEEKLLVITIVRVINLG